MEKNEEFHLGLLVLKGGGFSLNCFFDAYLAELGYADSARMEANFKPQRSLRESDKLMSVSGERSRHLQFYLCTLSQDSAFPFQRPTTFPLQLFDTYCPTLNKCPQHKKKCSYHDFLNHHTIGSKPADTYLFYPSFAVLMSFSCLGKSDLRLDTISSQKFPLYLWPQLDQGSLNPIFLHYPNDFDFIIPYCNG